MGWPDSLWRPFESWLGSCNTQVIHIAAGLPGDLAADLAADFVADLAVDRAADMVPDLAAGRAADLVAGLAANLAASFKADPAADLAADLAAELVAEFAAELVAELAVHLPVRLPSHLLPHLLAHLPASSFFDRPRSSYHGRRHTFCFEMHIFSKQLPDLDFELNQCAAKNNVSCTLMLRLLGQLPTLCNTFARAIALFNILIG